MNDFVLLAASWFLNQKVTTYDSSGNIIPDDGEYQRRGAERVYVFAEFMHGKGFLQDGVEVSRTPDFTLRLSQLTGPGQQFARAELDKWMRSSDRAGPKKKIDATGLERRWAKFVSSQSLG